MLTIISVGVLLFVLAAASDWFDTKYVKAVGAGCAQRAALCSVAMWIVSVGGLIAVIEVGWEVLPFEAAGLYVGTLLAMRN